MIPEESKQAMQIVMVREHVTKNTPEPIKRFVDSEFEPGELADQVLYGYVR